MPARGSFPSWVTVTGGGKEVGRLDLGEVQVFANSHDVQGADGYLSAFPPEEFAQTETFSSRSPAVPYYVMHKLLAGLLRSYYRGCLKAAGNFFLAKSTLKF